MTREICPLIFRRQPSISLIAARPAPQQQSEAVYNPEAARATNLSSRAPTVIRGEPTKGGKRKILFNLQYLSDKKIESN